MKIPDFSRYALGICAAVPMLAGRSGSGSEVAPPSILQAPGLLRVARQVRATARRNGYCRNALLRKCALMPTRNAMRRALTALVPLTMVAACSHGSQPFAQAGNPGTQTALQSAFSAENLRSGFFARHASSETDHAIRPSFMDRHAVGKALIFVSTYTSGSAGVVNIYQAGNPPTMVGQISVSAPEGLATDRAANLYVVSNSSILEYAPPYTGAPILTMDDPGSYGNGVAISPHGLIGVANFCTAPSCVAGTGSVVLYRYNHTEPCVTLPTPSEFELVFQDAFDDKGNLYIDGLGYYDNAVIAKVAGGCDAKKIRILSANSIQVAEGVQIDRGDRIAIYDPHQNTIFAYKPPRGGSLGNPAASVLIPSPGNPINFVFSKSGGNVYTAEQDSSGGIMHKFAYPAGGSPKYTLFVGGAPQGIAITSPLLP
jgi:hypothetical protein